MNFNAGPVQNQCHTVQKGHVFTSTFPEVPQNMEVWDWWSQDQRVWTPILNRVNLAVEVNDSGASHSACGVRHAAGRKKGNKQEWKNITRCCWTPNQWGRDILYIFINWIQLNFLYIAPNHKHRLRQEYPLWGPVRKWSQTFLWNTNTDIFTCRCLHNAPEGHSQKSAVQQCQNRWD